MTRIEYKYKTRPTLRYGIFLVFVIAGCEGGSGKEDGAEESALMTAMPAEITANAAEEAPSDSSATDAYYCGRNGEPCCPTNPACQAGLECNVKNICRTPCGASGQRCCGGSTCDTGNICSDGTCAPPCGGYNQPCCSTGCAAGLGCFWTINKCLPCGYPGYFCCPTYSGYDLCFTGICNRSTFMCGF